MSNFGLLGWVLVLITPHAMAGDADWLRLARRLSGENADRQAEVVSALRETPALEKKLLTALDDEQQRFLAYDVITELKLTSFFPRLVDRFVSDRSGFAVHAANRLASASQQQALIGAQLKALEDPSTSTASRVAMIDTLGRIGVKVPDETVSEWFRSDAFEIRSAGVEYLRTLLLQHRYREKASLLADALDEKQPTLLRAQVLFLLTELPASVKGRVASRLSEKNCEGLSAEGSEVKELCLRERGRR